MNTTQTYRDCIASALLAQPKISRRHVLAEITELHNDAARVEHIFPDSPAQMKKDAKALAKKWADDIAYCKLFAKYWRGKDADKSANHAMNCAVLFAAWEQAQAILSASQTRAFWKGNR